MSTPPSAIQALARQLIATEAARRESTDSDAHHAARPCERLRMPLTKLVGVAGFASLLSRALALASRQAPSLSGLRVQADGSLAGFDDAQKLAATTDASAQAGEILMAELLGLLVTFIGQQLTLTLVREAWPETSLETLALNTEGKP